MDLTELPGGRYEMVVTGIDDDDLTTYSIDITTSANVQPDDSESMGTIDPIVVLAGTWGTQWLPVVEAECFQSATC